MANCNVCNKGEIEPQNNGFACSPEIISQKVICNNCGQTYDMDFELVDYQNENY